MRNILLYSLLSSNKHTPVLSIAYIGDKQEIMNINPLSHWECDFNSEIVILKLFLWIDILSVYCKIVPWRMQQTSIDDNAGSHNGSVSSWLNAD